jgi:hypothetical protein
MPHLKPPPLALAALVALSAPAAAIAHVVVEEVDRRGDDLAVRLRYAGGKPLAGARYEVVSPASPQGSHDAGRTDRDGWVVVSPDAPGTWTIRIADATGHGRVVTVEVSARAPAGDPPGATVAPAPDAAAPAAIEAPADPAVGRESEPSASLLARLTRPLAGGAVLVLAFAGVHAVQRRRRAAGR